MKRMQAAHGVTIAWHDGTMPTSMQMGRRAISRELLHALLTERAQLWCGSGFELFQQCPECGSEGHGPIRVHLLDEDQRAAGPLVSVSYADGLAVAALAPDGATAFGIDVEFDTPESRQAAAEALGCRSTPVDGRQLRRWIRLEASAKARGSGLRGDWAAIGGTDLILIDTALPTGLAPALLGIALGLPTEPLPTQAP